LDGDVSLNMLRMALELSKTNEIYENISVKFFQTFYQHWAMHHIIKKIYRFGTIKTAQPML
jgi:hypothetical protein